jgi:hypothetical protein
MAATTNDVSLAVPARGKCGWIREIFNFKDAEMAHVLNVSVETLRNWLKDPSDAQASDSVRFHRLLSLAQLAKGVIVPQRMGQWLHTENKALGDFIPANLLVDPAGYRLVATLIEDMRTGISD